MAFYPDVSTGETFKPNAQLSNDVRHLINGMNGFSSKATKNRRFDTMTIKCYNATTETIALGTAVSIDSTDVAVDEILPIVPYDGTTFSGVTQSTLLAGECGEVVVIGSVSVEATGSGDWVTPVTGGTFIRSSSGVGRILLADEDTSNMLVFLGMDMGSGDSYNSYFKIIDVTDYTAETLVYKISIVDGRTYDPSVPTNGDDLRCLVNGQTWAIAPRISATVDLTDETSIVYIYLTAQINGVGTSGGTYEPYISYSSEPLTFVKGADFISALIGRVSLKGTVMSIVQDNYGELRLNAGDPYYVKWTEQDVFPGYFQDKIEKEGTLVRPYSTGGYMALDWVYDRIDGYPTDNDYSSGDLVLALDAPEAYEGLGSLVWKPIQSIIEDFIEDRLITNVIIDTSLQSLLQASDPDADGVVTISLADSVPANSVLMTDNMGNLVWQAYNLCDSEATEEQHEFLDA